MSIDKSSQDHDTFLGTAGGLAVLVSVVLACRSFSRIHSNRILKLALLLFMLGATVLSGCRYPRTVSVPQPSKVCGALGTSV